MLTLPTRQGLFIVKTPEVFHDVEEATVYIGMVSLHQAQIGDHPVELGCEPKA